MVLNKTILAIVCALLVSACTSQAASKPSVAEPPSQLATVINSDVPHPSPTPAPARKPKSPDPEIRAKAAVVYDVASATVLFSRNPNERLMPASTTKIMSMVVALENYDDHEVITITRGADAIGHSVDVKPDDQFRAIDLITAMMVKSGNDTAVSLADHFPTGYSGFVTAMNAKAQALGMKNSHFTNVSGVEEENHYSSALDLTSLAAYAMQDQRVRTITATKTTSVRTIDGRRTYILENTNQLLGEVEGMIGIKTGWTPVAGECLVTYIDRDKDIITVILGSPDRFGESKHLIEWAYQSFIWPTE